MCDTYSFGQTSEIKIQVGQENHNNKQISDYSNDNQYQQQNNEQRYKVELLEMRLQESKEREQSQCKLNDNLYKAFKSTEQHLNNINQIQKQKTEISIISEQHEKDILMLKQSYEQIIQQHKNDIDQLLLENNHLKNINLQLENQMINQVNEMKIKSDEFNQQNILTKHQMNLMQQDIEKYQLINSKFEQELKQKISKIQDDENMKYQIELKKQQEEYKLEIQYYQDKLNQNDIMWNKKLENVNQQRQIIEQYKANDYKLYDIQKDNFLEEINQLKINNNLQQIEIEKIKQMNLEMQKKIIQYNIIEKQYEQQKQQIIKSNEIEKLYNELEIKFIEVKQENEVLIKNIQEMKFDLRQSLISQQFEKDQFKRKISQERKKSIDLSSKLKNSEQDYTKKKSTIVKEILQQDNKIKTLSKQLSLNQLNASQQQKQLSQTSFLNQQIKQQQQLQKYVIQTKDKSEDYQSQQHQLELQQMLISPISEKIQYDYTSMNSSMIMNNKTINQENNNNLSQQNNSNQSQQNIITTPQTQTAFINLTSQQQPINSMMSSKRNSFSNIQRQLSHQFNKTTTTINKSDNMINQDLSLNKIKSPSSKNTSRDELECKQFKQQQQQNTSQIKITSPQSNNNHSQQLKNKTNQFSLKKSASRGTLTGDYYISNKSIKNNNNNIISSKEKRNSNSFINLNNFSNSNINSSNSKNNNYSNINHNYNPNNNSSTLCIQQAVNMLSPTDQNKQQFLKSDSYNSGKYNNNNNNSQSSAKNNNNNNNNNNIINNVSQFNKSITSENPLMNNIQLNNNSTQQNIMNQNQSLSVAEYIKIHSNNQNYSQIINSSNNNNQIQQYLCPIQQVDINLSNNNILDESTLGNINNIFNFNDNINNKSNQSQYNNNNIINHDKQQYNEQNNNIINHDKQYNEQNNNNNDQTNNQQQFQVIDGNYQQMPQKYQSFINQQIPEQQQFTQENRNNDQHQQQQQNNNGCFIIQDIQSVCTQQSAQTLSTLHNSLTFNQIDLLQEKLLMQLDDQNIQSQNQHNFNKFNDESQINSNLNYLNHNQINQFNETAMKHQNLNNQKDQRQNSIPQVKLEFCIEKSTEQNNSNLNSSNQQQQQQQPSNSTMNQPLRMRKDYDSEKINLEEYISKQRQNQSTINNNNNNNNSILDKTQINNSQEHNQMNDNNKMNKTITRYYNEDKENITAQQLNRRGSSNKINYFNSINDYTHLSKNKNSYNSTNKNIQIEKQQKNQDIIITPSQSQQIQINSFNYNLDNNNNDSQYNLFSKQFQSSHQNNPSYDNNDRFSILQNNKQNEINLNSESIYGNFNKQDQSKIIVIDQLDENISNSSITLQEQQNNINNQVLLQQQVYSNQPSQNYLFKHNNLNTEEIFQDINEFEEDHINNNKNNNCIQILADNKKNISKLIQNHY